MHLPPWFWFGLVTLLSWGVVGLLAESCPPIICLRSGRWFGCHWVFHSLSRGFTREGIVHVFGPCVGVGPSRPASFNALGAWALVGGDEDRREGLNRSAFHGALSAPRGLLRPASFCMNQLPLFRVSESSAPWLRWFCYQRKAPQPEIAAWASDESIGEQASSPTSRASLPHDDGSTILGSTEVRICRIS